MDEPSKGDYSVVVQAAERGVAAPVRSASIEEESTHACVDSFYNFTRINAT